MKLNKKTLKALDASNVIKAKLQDVLKKSNVTIQRYIDSNDVMLTTIGALTVIESELGINYEDAIEKEKA